MRLALSRSCRALVLAVLALLLVGQFCAASAGTGHAFDPVPTNTAAHAEDHHCEDGGAGHPDVPAGLPTGTGVSAPPPGEAQASRPRQPQPAGYAALAASLMPVNAEDASAFVVRHGVLVR